jgi:F420-non-reducing hydrogenase iron-sulfur subunit
VSRLQYTTDIKLIRVMCTGRVDLSFVLRAFAQGKDGVFIGGCHLGDCHYVTEGNHHALHTVLLAKKLLKHIGVNPERLRIEWISAGEGIRFAEVVNDFSKKLRALGPLGTGEGIDAGGLKIKFEALTRLLPYIRLVETEKLRVHFDTEKECEEFFSSDEVDKLLRELVVDKLEVNQIMLLLGERPLSMDEMSEALNLTPSEVSRHLSSSARQGLVRYDEAQQRFALAC